MNHSGDAAEQIVSMSLEGVEVVAKITGSAAKEIAIMLIAALKNKSNTLKPRGKARLTSMLKSGKPLEVFSVRESDLKQFTQGAKQYGIVYCALRNAKNSPDGLVDILVKADDAPKISRMVERFKFATVDKARIESEIIAEKELRVEDLLVTTDMEPDAPELADTERLLDDLLGVEEGRAEPDKPAAELIEPGKSEPGKEADPRPLSDSPLSPPSGRTSGRERNSERDILSKPSVRGELADIKAARREKEKDAAERGGREPSERPRNTRRTAEHRQPQNTRPKPKKVKESR